MFRCRNEIWTEIALSPTTDSLSLTLAGFRLFRFTFAETRSPTSERSERWKGECFGEGGKRLSNGLRRDCLARQALRVSAGPCKPRRDRKSTP